MKQIVLSALVAIGLGGAAGAQAYQANQYDGRNVQGWSYSAQGQQAAGLPTWYPSAGNTGDGSNCNIGLSPINGTRAEYMEYFNSVSPQVFAEQLRAAGTDVVAAHSTEVIDLNGRPAMRNVLTARMNGQEFDFMIVTVSGATTMATLTCTVTQGGFLARSQAFNDFVNGMDLLTTPPR